MVKKRTNPGGSSSSVSGDTVVVAVRVRPFNDREKKRDAKLIIEMPDGKRTCIRDPSNPSDEKWFEFDHSYWSHDGFKTEQGGYLAPNSNGSPYADQRRVFSDLGKGVLDNAWAGYNCSLFAYGCTGSGKSYSMVGTKENKGIIPIVCEELFERIAKAPSGDTQYEVSISMFEIYCERIRDLLDRNPPPKGGLKMRENPAKGFYVEKLSVSPVANYKAIEAKIAEGTKNRTIAATNMNATSSRAHTIVKLLFTQKSGGGKTTKTSEINLVDLAGSERQKDAGSEGDRLKEGIVINQSLSTLGRVIKALQERQTGKSSVQVPYRDSVLTALLKNALGGNSKTIMIAALSPADINYEETLSTLRFADRTKSIRTSAVVNENPTEKLIRQLREENSRLQGLIGGKVGSNTSDNQEEIENLRRQLEENQRELAAVQQTWQQRLDEAKRADQASESAVEDGRRKSVPHLWNLNEDPALSNVLVHFLPSGEMTIGKSGTQPPPGIALNGLSIESRHAVVANKGNKSISVRPISGDVFVNGEQLRTERQLKQNDRVLFGSSHLYVFHNPLESGARTDLSYDDAMAELARHQGVGVGPSSKAKSKADLILEQELIELLPLVKRANAMAKACKRDVSYDVVLVSPEARGALDGLTQVYVKASRSRATWMWDRARFLARYYGMQELYQDRVEGANISTIDEARDPFVEPPGAAMQLGSCVIYLQTLAYLMDFDEDVTLVDLEGRQFGTLHVVISATSPSVDYVDEPQELVVSVCRTNTKLRLAQKTAQRGDPHFQRSRTVKLGCRVLVHLSTLWNGAGMQNPKCK